jgi:hypothetical protein
MLGWFGPVLIPVYEDYRDYQPPRYARAAISRILAEIPVKYLAGLQSVVLTNSMAVGRGKTGRVKGKKYVRNKCLGFYHPKWKGDQPWIEIVVDNIVAAYFGPGIPPILSRFPMLQNLAFADTLFHEIGHHLDHTVGAPAPGGEAAAEAWSARLIVFYFRRRYWYLVPFVPVAKVLVRVVRKSIRAA